MSDQHLVILTPGFPSSEDDTSCLPSPQNFVIATKSLFPRMVITVITLHYPFRTDHYKWNGVNVYSFNGRNGSKFRRLWIWWNAWQRLRKLSPAPSAILSLWCGEACWLASRFARKRSIPHRCWILGQDARKENRFVHRIRPLPEELVAVSDSLAAEFLRNHNIKPAAIVPNGILPYQFPPNGQLRDIDVLGAGSLIELKAYPVFLRCIASLVKRFPKLNVVICGEGPLARELKKMAVDMEIQEHVRFAGALPHVEVLKLMRRTRVLLHPSSFEGFSTVCLEALYAGARVISFHQPMDLEISGWHIAKNEDQMHSLLVQCLEDPSHSQSLMPFSMEDSAIRMHRLLFNQSATQ